MGSERLPYASKVLVWRLSAFGDIILTTPLLALLQSYRPDVEIHYAVKTVYAEAIEHNPDIDQLIKIEQLRNSGNNLSYFECYHAILDLQANTLSRRLFRNFSSKVYRVNKYNFAKLQMSAFKRRLKIPHIVERYCEVLKPLGINSPPGPLRFDIPSAASKTAELMLSSWSLNYSKPEQLLAFVIGASYGTKQWPADMWAELIRRVPYPTVLLGGPQDEKVGTSILSQLDKSSKKRVLNVVGRCNFTTSAALIDQCTVVVTPDTGLMHVAAALKKHILVIWGNTVPEFGMSPWQANHLNAEVTNLWCRPCSKLGYARCPLGHFSCMKKLKVEQVESALLTLLELAR
jgi:heptosyltransferase-2